MLNEAELLEMLKDHQQSAHCLRMRDVEEDEPTIEAIEDQCELIGEVLELRDEISRLRQKEKWVDGKVECPKSGRDVIIRDSNGLHLDRIDPAFGNFQVSARTDYDFKWIYVPSPDTEGGK